jgi:uncharacterized membrane protein
MLRKLILISAAAAALFVVAATRPAPALANFNICNDSGEKIWVAIAYHDANAGNWVSRGWWTIGDGECKTPLAGDLTNQYYYLFGDGDQHFWKGSHTFCVDNTNAFTLNEADTTCDYTMRDFFEVDTGNLASYTYTFK